MKDLKIAVFGNVKFSTALLSLEDIVCVVTESQLVAQAATEAGIKLVVNGKAEGQDEIMKLLIALEEVKVNLILVSGYGTVEKEIADYPLYGTIELRPSLAPGYEGRNAVNWPILNGDEFGGVSAVYLSDVESDDEFEVIEQMKIPIAEDKAGDMYQYMLEEAPLLLGEIIEQIKADASEESPYLPVSRIKKSTAIMPAIDKNFRKLVFTNKTDDIMRKIRGLSPMPGAFANLKFNEKLSLALNILDAKGVVEDVSKDHRAGAAKITSNSLRINTSDGYIELKQVQINNKKQMSIADFLANINSAK